MSLGPKSCPGVVSWAVQVLEMSSWVSSPDFATCWSLFAVRVAATAAGTDDKPTVATSAIAEMTAIRSSAHEVPGAGAS